MPRYSTLKKGVKLQPGQILAFEPGRGYYAKAKPPPPMQPIIDRQVQGALAPQRAEIADQRNRTVELAKALAELQRGVGPATNAAYQNAAQTIGGLAQGFTGAARDAAEADAAEAAAALQRIGAPAEQIAQVQGVGQGMSDFNYALGGAIPGGALAREGAAFAAAQNMLPATALGRGQMAVYDLDKQERELALQIPELQRQFKNDLIAQRMAEEEAKLKSRAQSLYEAQYGLDVVAQGEKTRHNKATEAAAKRRNAITARNYSLALKNHQLAVKKANAEGRQVDAAASKGLGKLVDQNGRPILGKNGKPIPFKTGAKPASKSGLTPYQQSQQRSAAIAEARELRGEPIEVTDPGPGEGKYVGKNGGTTNDIRKAKRDGEYTFSEAQAYLVASYGITRSKARAWLMSAGWKTPKKKKTLPRPVDKPRG